MISSVVIISSLNDLYCVEWDVKPYSTQPVVNIRHLNFTFRCIARLMCSLLLMSYFFVTTQNSVYNTRICTQFAVICVWMQALYNDFCVKKCFTVVGVSRLSVVLRSNWWCTVCLSCLLFLCVHILLKTRSWVERIIETLVHRSCLWAKNPSSSSINILCLYMLLFVMVLKMYMHYIYIDVSVCYIIIWW